MLSCEAKLEATFARILELERELEVSVLSVQAHQQCLTSSMEHGYRALPVEAWLYDRAAAAVKSLSIHARDCKGLNAPVNTAAIANRRALCEGLKS